MNQKTITINEMLHGKMRGMELNRTVNVVHYNLDMIISLGYRIKSTGAN